MRLPQHLAEQLRRVPKSWDGYCAYAPCRVTLNSGEVLDRVYIVEASDFRRMWGHTQATVDVADIEQIEDSPFRLPARWANALYQAGESGMGYTLFVARLRDGSILPFVVGNAVDFPNWPPGDRAGRCSRRAASYRPRGLPRPGSRTIREQRRIRMVRL